MIMKLYHGIEFIQLYSPAACGASEDVGETGEDSRGMDADGPRATNHEDRSLCKRS